jgi:hypothetical protein
MPILRMKDWKRTPNAGRRKTKERKLSSNLFGINPSVDSVLSEEGPGQAVCLFFLRQRYTTCEHRTLFLRYARTANNTSLIPRTISEVKGWLCLLII